jgi:hypothetical protein
VILWNGQNTICVRKEINCVDVEEIKVPASEEVPFDDLFYDPDSSTFWFRCRCGQELKCTENQMDSGEELVIECKQCSLSHKIVI